MRFLVTGATGFVGGAVARRLLSEDDEVSVLVRDMERASHLTDLGAELHEGTLGDPNAIATAAKGCDVVIHGAAAVSHLDSPRALSWINVAGTENVINAARHAGCERVVHISCADVTLSNQDRVHWNEERDLMGLPMDAHARSKKLAEDLAISSSTTDLEVTALRPAFLWGPGDLTHLPLLCREGLAGGLRLVGSGSNLISTTYIDNLVDAIILASEVDGADGHAYYVTDNEFVDARELFEQLCGAAGLPPPRAGLPYPVAYGLATARSALGGGGLQPTDVVKRGRPCMFDSQNAMNDLNWEPGVDMAEGMKRLAAWVKEEGGPAALAKRCRAPIEASAVDEQVAAANGE